MNADPTVTRVVLPNGVRVVVEPMPGAHSVSIGVWVGVGSRDEPAEIAGVSHFLEHLLFKGTQRLSAREIAEAIDGHGGEMNAFTTKEQTSFYVRVPASAWSNALAVLADVVTSPALRSDDVESERKVIVEEMLADADSPEDRVGTLFASHLYWHHPLGRDISGSLETVAAITPERVREFCGDWYRGSNMVVAVAGAVDPDAVVREVGERFGNVAAGDRPVRVAPVLDPKPLAVSRRKTEQAHLVLGMRGITSADPDRAALAVLDHVLGGGMSSRLFQTIREERGLVYSVFSEWVSYADAGAFSIYAGTAPSQVREVISLIETELDQLIESGITADELTRAKRGFEGGMLLSLEDSASRMSRIGRSEMIYGRVPRISEFLDRLRAVELADVQRMAHRVLASPRTLAVVGPFSKKAFAA